VEAARRVIEYLQGSVLLSLTIGFISGWASAKLVSRDRRSGPIYFLAVGLLGLFLGEFMLVSFQLDEYIEPIAEFRLFFDLLAALIGAFFVAAIVHFIKPT
jgi:uncharacterized membrane protein YeaQ/YmgE (transglycosylase-associated protein family)